MSLKTKREVILINKGKSLICQSDSCSNLQAKVTYKLIPEKDLMKKTVRKVKR